MLEQHQTQMSLMRADLTSWLLDQRQLTSDNAAAQLTLIFTPVTCSEEGCLGCPGSLHEPGFGQGLTQQKPGQR